MKRLLLFLLALVALSACQFEKKPSAPLVDTSQVIQQAVDSTAIADSAARAAFIADSLEFRRITKLINGGYNGFDDRWRLYLRAKQTLIDTAYEK